MSDSGVVEQSSVVLSQNGDRSSSILKKTSSFLAMESIKSVSENPFFKHFGVRHNVPVDFRRNYRPQNQEQQGNRHSLNDISSLHNEEEEEDVVEYRPYSGFVNKLLDKFSSLNTRDEQTSSLSRLKRFSSLDQLQVENELTQDKISKTSPETSSTLDRPSKLSGSKAKSIENLSNAHLKPLQYNRYGSSLQSPGRNVDKYKASKFQSDLDLSRRDIIIIENTPSVSIKGSTSDDSIEKNASFNTTSHSDNAFQDEMPKPNTVHTVRTIFENASQTNLLLQRRTSDQPLSPSSSSFKPALSSLQTEQYASGQDEASKRNSLQSISPTFPRHGSEILSKPVLVSNGSSFKRQFENPKRPSDTYFNSKPDVQSLTLNSLISSGTSSSDLVSSPSDNSSLLSISETASQPSNDYKSSSFEGVKITASTKSSGSQTSSSRSTASVKPILISEHIAPIKPVPLSTPASSTTTYQKSRPVVSVAPYREKPEDGQKSDYSSSIFTDSKLSPRHDKPQRSVLDTQLTNFSVEDKHENISDDMILPREAKKIFEKGITTKGVTKVNNKIQSHEKRSLNVSHKNTENNITNQNKMEKITLEIRNSQTGIEDKEHQLLTEIPNQVERDFDLKPGKLVAESNTKLSRVKRIAPEPPGISQTKNEMFSTAFKQISKDQNKDISLIVISDEDTPQIPATRDVISPSKRPHSNDTEIINEQPPKKQIEYESGSQKQPVKGLQSQDQPVKGIPSIIAQRLKQPNSNPSQTNSGLVKIINPSNQFNNMDNNLYSRTLLTPTGPNKISSENAEKSDNSSELENEITAVRRKMEANRSKSGGPAQIFDSSQLKKKKKQQPPSGGAVPSLDLSAITDEIMEYQPQMTKVQPCNIVFVGENAKTARSLLEKKRRVKVNIHFNDEKIETYEYPSQEVALEDYLEDHPHEREEIVVLEDGVLGDSTDSSDDVETEVYLAATPIKDGGLLISNTSLSHSGNFQSYRGRYQEEYQFGTALVEEPKEVNDPEPDTDPEKLMLRPAEEDDTNTWSTSDSSDLLF